MATNLDLDPALIEAAVALGGRRTKKGAVTEICAVAERRQLSILTTDDDFVRFSQILPIAIHGRSPNRP